MNQAHQSLFKENGVGVVVSEILRGGGSDEEFMRLANLSLKYPVMIPIGWRGPQKIQIKGLAVFYAEGRQGLQLFGFPGSLPLAFLLSDIRIPTPIVGFVIVVSLSDHVLWEEIDTRSLKKMIKEEAFSGLAWARANGLPFVIVATDSESALITLDEFRNLLEIESTTPILTYPKDLGAQEVDLVLSALLGHIQSKKI